MLLKMLMLLFSSLNFLSKSQDEWSIYKTYDDDDKEEEYDDDESFKNIVTISFRNVSEFKILAFGQ